jgi:hypothetical protein
LPSIFIDAEMLEYKAEGADGRVVCWELMVIEIVSLGRVLAADIDDCDSGVGEIFLGGFAANDGHAVHCGEEATGEEFVFMSAARMGKNKRG